MNQPELDDVAESDGKFAVTFWEMSHFLGLGLWTLSLTVWSFRHFSGSDLML